MTPHVLIIEDDEMYRRLCVDRLELCGCAVKAVGSVSEGWKSVLEDSPDLILCDMQLPEQDGDPPKDYLGSRLCRQIRNAGQRHVPVVLMTAFYLRAREMQAAIMESGATVVLDKSDADMWSDIQGRVRHISSTLQ